jgi:hypothetical protein
MKNRNSYKLAPLFFLGCAIVIAGFAYQIVSSDPAAHAGLKPRQGRGASADTTVTVDRSEMPVSLQVDQAALIGRSRIVFRGLADGRVRFDHFLLDFNPRYAFKYEVPVDTAKDGFAIGTHRLQVTYVGGDWVHFRLLDPSGPARG